MSSPQKENGYTAIANELMEKLSLPGINGSEYRILLMVLRKTYGYQKKKDRISLSQFQLYTSMNRAQAVATIKSLVCKRILVKENGSYTFNKNYDEWLVCKRILPETSMQTHTTASMQKHTKTSMQLHTHKRKKENLQKKYSKNVFLQGSQWNELIDSFAPINPMYTEFYSNTTERSALDTMAKKWGYEKLLNTIKALEEICTKKYAPKITKPTELKRDIGKLVLFIKQEENSKPQLI